MRYGAHRVPDVWRLRKARTLVKLLALAEGHRLHRDIVVEALWPGRDRASAANNLHQAIHAARRTLTLAGAPPTVVQVQDDLVRLHPDGEVHTDLGQLVTAAAEALAGDDVEEMRSALALCRGELLPGDPFEDWLSGDRDRLAGVVASTRYALARALLDRDNADDVEEAVRLLHDLCRSRPFDEPAHRLLMGALDRAGRRWDALDVFEVLRSKLDADLAADPEPATLDLYRRLLVSGTHRARGSVSLPAASTTFVGRRRESRELARLARRTRLLTLTGPGGSGKTRLALELVRTFAADDPDRDCVVADLSGVRDPSLVPATVAATLGLTLTDRQPTAGAVAELLGTRPVLLLLDNCEHLLDAAATTAGALLQRCPNARLVTTSREPLRLPGETTWRVPSLGLPATSAPDGSDMSDEQVAALTSCESMQLLGERARSADPAFTLTRSNASAVARICLRLDGMPLALELAAARLAHLTPAELADRLDDALTVLSSRIRGAPDRQATLAATLAWSHDLLADDEAAQFRRVSVFAGGFTLDAAEAVVREGLDAPVGELLAALVDKSLVAVDTSAEKARYRLLEVVRQYAAERLAAAGEASEVLGRHATWYAAQAAGLDPDATSDGVVREPSPWFAAEQENLRLALATLLQTDPGRALTTILAMWRSLMSRGMHAEGARWLRLALEASPEPTAKRARGLFASAVFETRLGRAGSASATGREIAKVGRRLGGPELAQAMHEQSVLAWLAGEYEHADMLAAQTASFVDGIAPVEAAHDHLRAVECLCRGDAVTARHWLETALGLLEQVPQDTAPFFRVFTASWSPGSHDGLRFAVFEETMLVGTRVGPVQATAYVLCTLALAERVTGRYARASESVGRAVRLFHSCGDRSGEARALAQRGHLFRDLGDADRAGASFRSAVGLWSSIPDQRGLAIALTGHALAEAARGNLGAARAMADEACHMLESSGDLPGLHGALNNRAVVEVLSGRPADAAELLEQALALGAVPETHRSIGWQHLLLAGLRARAGDAVRAGAEARAALRVLRRVGERLPPELELLSTVR